MTLDSNPEHSVLEINGDSQVTNAKKSTEEMQRRAQDETEKLKNRVRAFTGAFVVMISPVLLAIVLKKVNLTGAGKYHGRIRTLEAFIDLVQRKFAHLAAGTLQMGIMPFLCVMVSEACASKPPFSYVAPRLVAASKVLVFLCNFLLMALGCGILLLFHKNALLVLTFCSVLAAGVVAVHIWYLCCCVVVDAGEPQQAGNDHQQARLPADAEAEAEYHSKLEHLLELSAGITAMMFLVLEFVALEGLMRNTHQLGQTLGPVVKGQETFLGGALLISFVASALGVSLMNVWTSPHVMRDCVVLTAEFIRGLNLVLQALPITAVVVLITLDVLPHAWKLAVWLPLFPPATVLLVLLARHYSAVAAGQQGAATGSSTSSSSSAVRQGAATGSTSSSPSAEQQQGSATGTSTSSSSSAGQQGASTGTTSSSSSAEQQQGSAASSSTSSSSSSGQEATTGSTSSSSLAEQQQGSTTDSTTTSSDEKKADDPKPASLELTKVAFTGFLAVAVPSITSASVWTPSIFFVLFSAATVLLGLLWRLLTHETEPPPYVLKAANHASFFAHVSVFFAGIAFWVMAASAVQ